MVPLIFPVIPAIKVIQTGVLPGYFLHFMKIEVVFTFPVFRHFSLDIELHICRGL